MNVKYRKLISGIGVGALLGFAYYYFIGCNSGSCAITSSPYNSTAYGALIGLVFMWPEKEKSNSDDNNSETTD